MPTPIFPANFATFTPSLLDRPKVIASTPPITAPLAIALFLILERAAGFSSISFTFSLVKSFSPNSFFKPSVNDNAVSKEPDKPAIAAGNANVPPEAIPATAAAAVAAIMDSGFAIALAEDINNCGSTAKFPSNPAKKAYISEPSFS